MLFVGDDWAEDHHDVEIVDEAGLVLARRRLPAGLAGITGLHAARRAHAGRGVDLEPAEAASRVKVGIETDRLGVAAGYEVFAINPMSVPGVGSDTPLGREGATRCRARPPSGPNGTHPVRARCQLLLAVASVRFSNSWLSSTARKPKRALTLCIGTFPRAV